MPFLGIKLSSKEGTFFFSMLKIFLASKDGAKQINTTMKTSKCMLKRDLGNEINKTKKIQDEIVLPKLLRGVACLYSVIFFDCNLIFSLVYV